jgi:hypothetical protein
VVIGAVGVKAANRTARKRMAKELLFSAVARGRTMLVIVDIMIQHRKIKMDCQQSI